MRKFRERIRSHISVVLIILSFCVQITLLLIAPVEHPKVVFPRDRCDFLSTDVCGSWAAR